MRRLPYLFVLGLLCVACDSGSSDSDASDSSGSSGTSSDPEDPFGDGEIPGEGGDSYGDTDGGGASSGGDEGGADPTGADTGADTGEGGDSGGDPGSGGGDVEPGTLTAGVWDDNLNYDMFSSYRAAFLDGQTAGVPAFETSEHDSAHDEAEPGAKQRLDVSLVIDTTGSMGDEITYLQTEFDALSSAIEAEYPNAEQRWSLVLYRDQTDEYVVRWFDFRDDLQDFRNNLAEQAASGGGDYPEAADQGLDIANQLTWRADDDVAKLMFWVADAPHHNERADALADAVRGARDQGVHIYPVASSGVDELTEFSMRAAAQLTGGRYIFLTDDSGVGLPHAEPTIPCYFVTKLDDAILRMVDVELSGTYQQPDPSEIIRTGGDPQNGACTLSDGQTVTAY